MFPETNEGATIVKPLEANSSKKSKSKELSLDDQMS